MACMSAQTRPQFIHSSKRVLGSEPMLIPRENPLGQKFKGRLNPRGCITQGSQPNTLPAELSPPQPTTLYHARQPAQHTTSWAIPAPTHDAVSRKAASPTHYQLSYPRPNPRRCITQGSQPNTLPAELSWPPSEVYLGHRQHSLHLGN